MAPSSRSVASPDAFFGQATQSPPESRSERRSRGKERESSAAVRVNSTITSASPRARNHSESRREPPRSAGDAHPRTVLDSELLGERRPGVTGHPASISQRSPQATYLRDRLDERRRLLLRLRDRVDPLVSPLRRQVLLTVAAAMRLAVPVLRPRLLAERLIFSYCRSRLLLQDLGIPAPRRRKRRTPLVARKLCIRLLGRKGEEQEEERQHLHRGGERIQGSGAAEAIVARA